MWDTNVLFLLWMLLRLVYQLSVNVTLKINRNDGWSEGSELSQLIVHSQLQIELLVLLFPPSHYCTWLVLKKKKKRNDGLEFLFIESKTMIVQLPERIEKRAFPPVCLEYFSKILNNPKLFWRSTKVKITFKEWNIFCLNHSSSLSWRCLQAFSSSWEPYLIFGQ